MRLISVNVSGMSIVSQSINSTSGCNWSNRMTARPCSGSFITTLANLPPQVGSPRVLLTTLSGEEHTLSLLMVEALLVVEDAYPVLLGPQTPIDGIVRAAQVKQVDAVCLSFSVAYSPALAAQGLRDLRQMLPVGIEIWAGGYGIKPIRKPVEGVCLVPEFQDLYDCLASWRSEMGNNAAD